MEISLLTWNIWFDEVERENRTRKIMEICQCLDPDFIAFQEVTGEALRCINRYKGQYKLIEDKLKQRYDTIILSKHNCVYRERIPLPRSEMGRNLLRGCFYLEAEAEGGGVGENGGSGVVRREINVGTFHLESVFKKNEIKLKEEQMKFIYDNSPSSCILMGDTNFGNNERLGEWAVGGVCGAAGGVSAGRDDGLVDIFERIGEPIAYKNTYTGKTNPFVNRRLNSRLDRIYTKNMNYSVKSFQLVGNEMEHFFYHEGVNEYAPPSDHYGVYCTIKID